MKTELYWIPGPWSGCLAIMPRPRGGDWLKDEIRGWRTAGVDIVVSALEPEEMNELDLAKEAELAKAAGIEYVSFAIPDRGVPPSMPATGEVLRPLEKSLGQGKGVAVHCRQGIGRSAMLAAGLLVLGGVGRPQEALDRIQKSRGCNVPDTPEQAQWVVRFAKDMGKVVSKVS
jgi:protein-tyrosine phosphatase